MNETQGPVSSAVRSVIAAHERWAYGEGWIAGLDEGKRQGFDDGYGLGFDVGADVGAARLLAALKAIVNGWSQDQLRQRCQRERVPALASAALDAARQ